MMCVFSLKEEFPTWYEKLVLEMVHHNTASLEKLVDSAWLEIMTKYAVGEECDFEVSAGGQNVSLCVEKAVMFGVCLNILKRTF